MLETLEAGNIEFRTSNTERMRIANNGNISIGSTAQSGRLYVSGGDLIVDNETFVAVNVRSYGTDAGSLFNGTRFRGTRAAPAAVQTNDGLVVISGQGYNGTAAPFTTSHFSVRAAETFTPSAMGSYISLNTVPNGSITGIERVRISSSGNVGIGTTNPTRTLVVNGLTQVAKDPVNAEPQLRFTATGSSEWALGHGSSSSDFRLRRFNGSTWDTVFDISESYRVGINNPVSGIGTLYVRQVANDINSGITVAATGGSSMRFFVDSSNQRTIASAGSPVLVFDDSLLKIVTSNTEKMRVTSTGDVGIGTTTPSHKLEVNGSFAATTKSFVIDHPSKPDHKLRYGSLEGPENGVYVRGKLISNNIIELPDYWVDLVDEDSITVQLTAIGSKQDIWVSKIENNCIYVESDIGKAISCFYFIQAERKDVDKLIVEYRKDTK
jgi:hypothetical protein